jgi:2,5-diamino-6-(ribosylamino)-4(3H)-pyrimidinone 5'-phosphate reductase
MMSSIDGRIVVGRWPKMAHLDEYERTAETYHAEAWMCGRITMEAFAGATRSSKEIERAPSPGKRPVKRSDFLAPVDTARYAVALDPSGRLRWQKNDIDGYHVVSVLSNAVSDEYLAFLREKGVSYIFARARKRTVGKHIDLALALEKLAKSFGIRTLLLEGGGGINGSMLSAGLVDELSVLIAPVADGSVGVPTLFDIDNARTAVTTAPRLVLTHVERRVNDIVWLRYSVGERQPPSTT